jgi:hypothetical protein
MGYETCESCLTCVMERDANNRCGDCAAWICSDCRYDHECEPNDVIRKIEFQNKRKRESREMERNREEERKNGNLHNIDIEIENYDIRIIKEGICIVEINTKPTQMYLTKVTHTKYSISPYEKPK